MRRFFKNFKNGEKTVQNFILKDGKVLLVHERGEPGEGGKPSGWGLPGGGVGVARTEEQILNQICKSLPVFGGIPLEKLDQTMKTILDWEWNGEDLKVFLTAILEGLEETGFLIKPVRELLSEENAPGHQVVVVEGVIVLGELCRHSAETDDCAWFDLDRLPEGVYNSHIRRIAKARQIIEQQEQEKEEEEEK